MKKVITLTTIISVILLGIVSSYASSNIAVNLTGNTKVKEGTKTIELTLSLGSFTDIKTDEILAVGYETTINYDDTLVKSVAVQGLNSWSATYEGSTKKLIGELDDSAIKQFKANTNIAKITITLKDDLKAGTIGKIKLNDLVLAYGDTKDTYDFTYNKEVTVTIEANATNSQEQSGTENTGSDKNSDDKNKQENITNNEQQNKDEAKTDKTTNSIDKNIANTNINSSTKDTIKGNGIEKASSTQKTNTDKTTATKKIPKTGIKDICIFVTIIIILVGIVCFIRYKNIELK